MISSIRPESVQASFNPTKHIYRVGNAEYTEYFILFLDSIPQTEGSSIKGSVLLRSSSLSRTYSSLSFTVQKVQGSLVWLWDPSVSVGVVVRTGL